MPHENYLVCDCGEVLTPIKILKDLDAMPYEWYIMNSQQEKMFLIKHDVFSCTKCRVYYIKHKHLRYLFYILSQIKNIIKESFKK